MVLVEFLDEIAVAVLLDGGAHLLHQMEQEAQIVPADQAQREDLVGLEQMPDVSAGEVFAGVAVATVNERL